MNIYQEILDARKRISPYIHMTQLEKSLLLSKKMQTNIYLKCEHLQKNGSFKIRGALNKILSLTDAKRAKGVVAASSGNHGMGVARAALITDTKATIYVPQGASLMKIASIKALGASVEEVESTDILHAELKAREVAEQEGTTFISPYNDHTVMAGQGTIGAELFEKNKDLDAVFIAVGGGGLISGISSYLKQVNPGIKIVGCWPENSPAMYECIKAGEVIEVPILPTISDGTAGGIEPGAITFEYCRDLIDEHVLVSETEIKTAMKVLAESERWVVEGAAAVAMAAYLKTAQLYKGKSIAVVLCGRNIAFEQFIEAIQI